MANRKANTTGVTDLTENVNFRMTPVTRAAIKRVAEQEDRSEAWVIRRLLGDGLRLYETSKANGQAA